MSEEELDEKAKEQFPLKIWEIDEEIRDDILWLNENGYITFGSCSGHNGKDVSYIGFRRKENLINLAEVLNVKKIDLFEDIRESFPLITIYFKNEDQLHEFTDKLKY